jgi:hypothetical protein
VSRVAIALIWPPPCAITGSLHHSFSTPRRSRSTAVSRGCCRSRRTPLLVIEAVPRCDPLLGELLRWLRPTLHFVLLTLSLTSPRHAGPSRRPHHAHWVPCSSAGRAPLWASPVVHGPLATMAQARAGHAASCERWAAAQFWPSSAGSNEIPFQFHFSLNFKISYLSVRSSKNYETDSVGFIILRYIHEKC